MRFGKVRIEEAEGAVLAHATVAGETRLRKAHRLTASDIEALRAAGIREVIAAVLAPDDLDEDAAAERIASVFRSENVDAKAPATGRVNLHARTAGVLTVDKAMIDAVNRVDPSITVATLAPHTTVEEGRMVATVKIIPFAVPAVLVEEAVAQVTGEAFAVKPFTARRVGLIQTRLPGVKESVLDKTARITAARLARSGSTVTTELRPPHEDEAVAAAIARLAADNEMVLVFGASAICDDNDVVPAAIRAAGGNVARVGMPVDPGNLLVMGALGEKPVIGTPGCARSPKLNGFDWVLDRLMAGIDVGGADIAGMGVGGLLMEIATRPQPRETRPREGRTSVWAVLLAAGQSRRMGARNKLLADFGGVPLVRRTAERVASSAASGTVVVLGHQRGEVAATLAGIGLRRVFNPDHALGLSGSLKAGIAALPEDAAGALVVLADMPEVTTADLDRMIAAFRAGGGKAVVRATHNGKRGNPVILPRALFAEVRRLQGDTGARQVVEASPLEVVDVEIGAAASVDVDTPEALREAGGVLAG